jgi:hypothetical protein
MLSPRQSDRLSSGVSSASSTSRHKVPPPSFPIRVTDHRLDLLQLTNIFSRAKSRFGASHTGSDLSRRMLKQCFGPARAVCPRSSGFRRAANLASACPGQGGGTPPGKPEPGAGVSRWEVPLARSRPQSVRSPASARDLDLFSFMEMYYSNRLLYLQTGDTLSPAGSPHHYCKDHLGHWDRDEEVRRVLGRGTGPASVAGPVWSFIVSLVLRLGSHRRSSWAIASSRGNMRMDRLGVSRSFVRP